MEKGIVIIAVSYLNYARMASNLAQSIKINNPDTHITLLHDNKAIENLMPTEKKFFDNFIEIPNEFIQYNGRNAYGRLKCFIYDLSPYQKTIYIDSDTLMIPNKSIEWYWEAIDKYDHLWISWTKDTVYKYNSNTISSWTTIGYIHDLFPNLLNREIVTNLQTSLIGFKKKQEIKNIFESSKKVHDALHAHMFKSTWYNTIPDELIIAVGMCENNIIPTPGHQFVTLIFQKPTLQELRNEYNFISFASAQSSVQFTYKNLYDQYVTENAKKLGIPYPYLWKDKGLFIRQNSVIRKR